MCSSAYGDELASLLEADILLQWRLRADGYKLFQTPEVKVEHAGETRMKTIFLGFFLVMRFFAPLRAQIYHWSPLKRALRLLLTPLIPFYRTARLYVSLARRRSPDFWKALPGAWIVFAANIGGAAGEAAGLIGGVPVHDRRFLIHEMNTGRDSPEPSR